MEPLNLRDVFKHLLSAISVLWSQRRIDAEEKRVLKKLVIVRHPVMLEAALAHVNDAEALQSFLVHMCTQDIADNNNSSH